MAAIRRTPLTREPRPTLDEFKMSLAVEVASRSNCVKSHVGAVILVGDRVRSVGYNGTVEGYRDCFDGGCPRCKDPNIRRGEQMDRCICVHAEENALITAARYGISVDGAECFVTHEPCLGCTKLLIQAHVKRVVYLTTYQYADEADHNENREAMRRAVRRRVGFVQYGSRPRDVVDRWIGRLEEMKSRAQNYARFNGVL